MTKNKKKFLGIFAILFALLFAVGLVFGAACKKDKDEDDDATTEHVHSYTKINHNNDSHWYECPDDGAVDESTVAAHSADSTKTDPATCTDPKTTTYTCSCGYSWSETEGDPLGHSYTAESLVTFDWTTFDETDLSGVTATIACAVCGEAPVAFDGTYGTIGVELSSDETQYVATAASTDGTVTYENTANGTKDVVVPEVVTLSAITLSDDTVVLTANGTATVSIASVTLSDGSVVSDATAMADYIEGAAWSTSDSTVATISDGTVSAAGTGICAVTVKVGEIEASCAVVVKADITDLDLVSQYFVDELNATSGDKVGGTDETTEEINSVTENDYFTITSPEVTLEYSVGGSTSNPSNNMTSLGKEPTVTLSDGTSRTFTLGLKQNDSVETNGTNQTKSIVVTANDDITLYLYVGLVNDSHSSDRPGYIYYSVNDGAVASVYQSNRTKVATIEVTLKADDVLTIYAVPDYLEDSSKTDGTLQSAKLWLYGAEAYGVEASSEAEESGDEKTEYALTGTYDAETQTWTYTDGSDTFTSFEKIEGTIVSVTLTASDVDSFTAACVWDENVEIVPVIEVNANITITSKISVSGCEKVIVLNADITLTAGNDVTTLGIYTDVTIDLNGHNIARAEGYTGTVGTIQVDGSTSLGCGNLTIKDSVGTGTVSGTYALSIFSTTATTGETSFTLVSGTITGSYAAIASNGMYPLVTINIYGGTVASTGEINPAIFLPSGTLNLYNGTVTGTAGIEVRGGVANIYGGTITATGTPDENVDETTSNGPVASGYAVAQTWNSSYPASGAINISGSVVIVGSIYAKGDNVARISITGGTFSVDPSAYLSGEYGATVIADGEYVGYYIVAEKEDGDTEAGEETPQGTTVTATFIISAETVTDVDENGDTTESTVYSFVGTYDVEVSDEEKATATPSQTELSGNSAVQDADGNSYYRIEIK